MLTLCLEPSRARSMASADMRTRRRGGLLNLPLRSNSFWLRSSSCGEEKWTERAEHEFCETGHVPMSSMERNEG